MTRANDEVAAAHVALGRGTCIGRYVVLNIVGRGAMGEVYAAYDPELDRKVAVKLLRAQPGGTGTGDTTTTGAKARLMREAQAIAKLSHPNVIGVHDVGSFGDQVFMAMEYIDGCTVGYWLLGARRPWREVLRVFTAAGHGLAAAHACGLVHRDFKAENVMLGRDDKIRVMDFGLARRLGGPWESPPVAAEASTAAAASTASAPVAPTGEEAELTATRVLTPPEGFGSGRGPVDARGPTPARPHTAVSASQSSSRIFHSDLSDQLTRTGAIVGTPAYMAPEQFMGNAADERSDQFSFCVALYEGLYGERPFPAKTPTELFEQIRRGAIRPAPAARNVPTWLRRVVLRGLSVDPSLRWPSMKDLLVALHHDPRSAWRRRAVAAAAFGAIVAMALGARQQGMRDSRPVCKVSQERSAGVWEPATAPGGRRAAITAAFRARGGAGAESALVKTASALDDYMRAWSTTYQDNCEATLLRHEQPSEAAELTTSCLGDRWAELRALSDVLAEPSTELVDNAAEAAAALTSPRTCLDVNALRVSASHSVALWTTPGTMSLVAPRPHRRSAGARDGGETESDPAAARERAATARSDDP